MLLSCSVPAMKPGHCRRRTRPRRKGFDDQTRRLKENMGTLETRADRTARAFKSMWDAVLDIGRPDTAQEMLIKAEAAFKKADDIWSLRKDDYFVNDEARARYWDDREKGPSCA